MDKIHIKPGSKVLYLGAASGTTVSHVADIVGPVSALMCENVAMKLQPLPPSPCVRKNVATHPSYLILQFISVSNSLHSPHYHFIPSPLHPITTHSIPSHSISSHSIPSHSITIHPITTSSHPLSLHPLSLHPLSLHHHSPHHYSPITIHPSSH